MKDYKIIIYDKFRSFETKEEKKRFIQMLSEYYKKQEEQFIEECRERIIDYNANLRNADFQKRRPTEDRIKDLKHTIKKLNDRQILLMKITREEGL